MCGTAITAIILLLFLLIRNLFFSQNAEQFVRNEKNFRKQFQLEFIES